MRLPGNRTANEADWKSIDALRHSIQPNLSSDVVVMEESMSGERDMSSVNQ